MTKVKFTALYDWLAERPDLNSTEKILIAHIMRFRRSGCFKSNNKIAHDLGLDRSTTIRAIKGLIDKEWIAPLYETRHNRVLFVSEVKLNDMPIFEWKMGSGKTPPCEEKKSVGSGKTPPCEEKKSVGSGKTPPIGSGVLHQGSGVLHQGSGETPLCVNKTSIDLSYIDERVLKEVNFLKSTMKEKTGKPTVAQFERRRQQLHKQLRED